MRPGPSNAKKIFIDLITVDAEPQSAVDWLVRICLDQGWFNNDADALEAAERWAEQFLNLLRHELNQLHEIGRFAAYTFNSSSDYLIQGISFVEPRDPDITRIEKERRALHGNYVSALGMLSPRQFEALCVGILGELGVDNPKLTKYSADEGIDFYGKFHLEKFIFPDDAFPGIQRQLTAWIIGQAKHYNAGQVSTFEIRDLVGAIELAKGKAFGSDNDKYNDLNLRVCDPVFYLFIDYRTEKMS